MVINMESKKYKNISEKKYSFSEVVEEKPEYLIDQIKNELPKKSVSNGSQVRISTLINLCDFLSKIDKKLDLLINNQLSRVKQ